MLPLSFAEFTAAAADEHIPREKIWKRYVSMGSFPCALHLREEAAADAMLEGRLCSVIVRDIQRRVRIADMPVLEGLCGFLFERAGTAVNVRQATDALNARG